jgi:hypothetical protein
MLTVFFEQMHVDISVRPPHRLGAVNNTTSEVNHPITRRLKVQRGEQNGYILPRTYSSLLLNDINLMHLHTSVSGNERILFINCVLLITKSNLLLTS